MKARVKKIFKLPENVSKKLNLRLLDPALGGRADAGSQIGPARSF